jgi:TPR repeat protein
MRKLYLLCSLVVSFIAHAEVYKCAKDGKVSYSDNPCDDAAIAKNRIAIKLSAGLTEGLSAFENGNYDLAFSKLNPLAESGVAMAQNTVGRMYLQGQGVAQDSNKALILFRKAANQGLANAKNNLGVMYAAGGTIPQDYKQAIAFFQQAADQGFSLAMNNLADMYEKGLGVNPDHVEADKWRKRSQNIRPAKNSTPIGIETVGKKEYEKGLGSYYSWDFAGAAESFRQAAEKGHPEAQLILASMYRQGQGVSKNEAKALYWAQKAKDGGHTMNDNRDRVLLNDISAEGSNQPQNGPAAVGGVSHGPSSAGAASGRAGPH